MSASMRAGVCFLVIGGALLAGAPTRGADVCPNPDPKLRLAPGFCATVFADLPGHPRHMVVAPDGTLYVNTWSGSYYGFDRVPEGGFVLALRDTQGGGHANVTERFGPSSTAGATGGTGIGFYHGALFVEAGPAIVRYTLAAGSIVPTAAPEAIVDGLPLTGDHPMHPFAIAPDGSLYVDLGSASNACQIKNRTLKSPGYDPCTELSTRGGIWRYDANRTGQHFSERERYALGIRNADGIALGASGALFATQHGRDQLYENWPALYQPIAGANLPAEELLQVTRGADYGWPECYYDPGRARLVLAPEYGGDGGDKVGVCASKQAPIASFPAHWAPNDLTFYGGTAFPLHYRGGAFIAFHGSWNRAPFPQEGYNVVFVPFSNGQPAGSYEIFGDGFAGAMASPSQAAHRPTGLAVAPDGALYIADDAHGRIWRVSYTGRNASTEAGSPAAPPEGIHPDAGAHPRGGPSTPTLSSADRKAGVTAAMINEGERVYRGELGGASCAGCHGENAQGGPLAPDLTHGHWLWADGSYDSILEIIRDGVAQPKQHTGVMPPMGGAQLTNSQLAAVAGYVFALSHPGPGH